MKKNLIEVKSECSLATIFTMMEIFITSGNPQ